MPTVQNLPIKPLHEEDIQKKNDTENIIRNITFFGDSAIPEGDPIYQSVWDTSKFLAEQGYTIINGGGPGIMKAATDGAAAGKGRTIAVYWQPKLASFFEGRNLANVTDESDASANYVMRTLGLIEKGDAYVVCKGGTGTVSEFGMVWCLAKLYYGCHKPVILFGDFWDDLIESFQKNMYIDETELGVLYHARTKEDVLRLLQEHELKIKSCVDRNFSSDEAAFVLGAREKLTKTTYNKVASSYHAEHAGKLVAQEQLDEFMSMVNPPAQVLDIGAGPGYDIKYLSEKYSVKGLEVSERFTQIARYENPGIDIELGDVVTLDIGINKYKGIWARDSIHHIPEEKLDIVFKKVADALVEEGIFYAIVREGEGEITENESKNYANLERFYHLFTADELTKRAEKAGLKLVKIDHSKRSHKWLIGVFKK